MVEPEYVASRSLKHAEWRGTMKRLFGAGAVPPALTLADSKRTSTGIVVNSYRRAGKPTYGSFGLDQ